MIQTRTRSLSETSVVPTQPLLFCRSRSNSAAIAGGHADLSARSVVLSSMVRAIAFLRGLKAQYRKPWSFGKYRKRQAFHGSAGPRIGHRLAHEQASWPPSDAF